MCTQRKHRTPQTLLLVGVIRSAQRLLTHGTPGHGA